MLKFQSGYVMFININPHVYGNVISTVETVPNDILGNYCTESYFAPISNTVQLITICDVLIPEITDDSLPNKH